MNPFLSWATMYVPPLFFPSMPACVWGPGLVETESGGKDVIANKKNEI